MNAFMSEAATRAWPGPVLVITHPQMLAYDHGDHDDEPVRLEAAWAGIDDAARAGIPVQRVAARPATRAELVRVHRADYLDALEGFTADAPTRMGIGTRDCPYSPGVLRAAQMGAGAAAQAANDTLAACGPTGAPAVARPHRAFCAVRPPGHHAHAAQAGGYCYLNNAMVAAHAFLAGGAQRVFIIDLDFHHGDGTAALVRAEPRCAYASLHASPLIAFPGTGNKDEHPRLFHEPLSRRPRAAWREAVTRLIACGRGFAPEAVVISLGTDCIAGDPVGDLGVTHDDFAGAAADVIAAWPALPVVSVLEGGYDVGNLRVAISAHIRVLGAGGPS
jgi:acetoin utilization deacetylase AcuC-like enzyme